MKKNFWIIVLLAVSTVMNIGCDNTEVITINCEDCGLEIPKFEKKYSQKCVVLNSDDLIYYFDEDSDKKYRYKLDFYSVEEAEWKMLNCFKPNGTCEYEILWRLFCEVIKSDTSTIAYTYDSQIEDYLSVVTSQDGNLRVYSFDLSDGSGGDYYNIVQYRWNGDVKITDYGFDKYDEEKEYGDEDVDCLLCANIDGIYDIVYGNKTYYLLSKYFRYAPCGYFACICCELTENGLMPVELFKDENGTHSEIESEYGYFMYIVKEKDGKVYRAEDMLDATPITIYVRAETIVDTNLEIEEVIYEKIGYDRYHKYVWDGRYFVREEGRDFANPFLCSQLHEYYSNEIVVETERNLIRIDYMLDGSYRYASWKVGSKMSDVPELVINNGYKTKDDEYYIFNNDGYEYKVGGGEVVVTKDKKVVGRWKY